MKIYFPLQSLVNGSFFRWSYFCCVFYTDIQVSRWMDTYLCRALNVTVFMVIMRITINKLCSEEHWSESDVRYWRKTCGTAYYRRLKDVFIGRLCRSFVQFSICNSISFRDFLINLSEKLTSLIELKLNSEFHFTFYRQQNSEFYFEEEFFMEWREGV